MKEITYSFIVPHHNTPDLLQRLIDSIPQREDVEIIVVDDNSNEDKKADISRLDTRVIYIDAEHTNGAGRARNVGMDAANGKWLLFADADDIYNQNFILILDEYKDENVDILFFNVDSVDSKTLKKGKINRARYVQKVSSSLENQRDEFLYGSWGPWRKMLSARFVNEYGFRYEEVPVGNDVLFAFQTSFFARSWKVEKRVVYTVTYVEGSISYSKILKNKFASNLISLRRRAEFYRFIGHDEWNRKSIRGKYAQSCMKYLYRLIKRQPLTGIEAIIYYLFHWFEIEKKSTYYVDVIKDIQRKMICREILNNNDI